MQVVYSGGMTSTPLSSPRCYRKESPGGGAYTLHYPQNPNYPPPPPSPRLLHKQLAKQQQRQRAAAASGGGGGGDGCRDNSPNAPRPVPGSLRNFIPAMKRPVAIACCVCNVLVPGLGTFLSGLTLKCGGSHSRLPGKTDRQVILTNMWVASLQFLTTFLFLLGWIWSVTWACAF
ncbi:protein SPEC3-like, partial [Argonauta hians]